MDGSDVPQRLKSDRNPRCQRAGRLLGEGDRFPCLRRLPTPSRVGTLSNRSIDLGSAAPANRVRILPRKEVIQPHLPVRLPCYDFVPITSPTFDGCLLAVGPPASGVTGFHDVTGGVYKAREHIHRSVLTCGY